MTSRYHLYVKVEGKWQWVSTIEARDHRQAFSSAMLTLKPEHYDKPIRLEQEEAPGVDTPPQPRHP